LIHSCLKLRPYAYVADLPNLPSQSEISRNPMDWMRELD